MNKREALYRQNEMTWLQIENEITWLQIENEMTWLQIERHAVLDDMKQILREVRKIEKYYAASQPRIKTSTTSFKESEEKEPNEEHIEADEAVKKEEADEIVIVKDTTPVFEKKLVEIFDEIPAAIVEDKLEEISDEIFATIVEEETLTDTTKVIIFSSLSEKTPCPRIPLNDCFVTVDTYSVPSEAITKIDEIVDFLVLRSKVFERRGQPSSTRVGWRAKKKKRWKRKYNL